MDQVRFRIGNLILGDIDSLPNDRYVFPQDLARVSRDGSLNDERVIALARLLQSLDSDNNPDNGITIDDSVKSSISEVETKFNADELESYLENVSINPDNIITQTEAQNHLRNSMQNMIGRENRNYQGGPGGQQQQGALLDLNNYQLSTLNQELKDAIAYMGNEERLARDVYICSI